MSAPPFGADSASLRIGKVEISRLAFSLIIALLFFGNGWAYDANRIHEV
jgi:hypothetical protein